MENQEITSPEAVSMPSLEDGLNWIREAEMRLSAVDRHPHAFLCAYATEWKMIFVQFSHILKPFTSIETAMSAPNAEESGNNKNTFVEFMCENWKKIIFAKYRIKLLPCVTGLVEVERHNKNPDPQLLADIFRCIAESHYYLSSDPNGALEFFLERLKKIYIADMKIFYIYFTSKLAKIFERHNISKCMRYIEAKVEEEEDRAFKYLGSCFASLKPFAECIVQLFVSPYKHVLIARCPGMIANNETEDLKLMYNLMNMTDDGVDFMIEDFEDYIIKKGLADVVASEDTINILDTEKNSEVFNELSRRCNKLVKESFNDDTRFLTTTRDALERVFKITSMFRFELPSGLKGVINEIEPESRFPFLLAAYYDMLLRKTVLSRTLRSDEMEGKLKQMLLALKYIQNKDEFIKYYKSNLTRRLLLDSSADREKDEALVEKFREIGMPEDGVNKLAKMFKDVKTSESFNQDLIDIHGNSKNLVLNVKILNESLWSDSNKTVQVSLPVQLENFVSKVEGFYQSRHSGRKLKWCHKLSTGTITFSSQVGKFDLDVTTYQLAVLFTWNERDIDKVSFEELRLTTEIPDAELRKTLWSLVANHRLRRQPLLFETEVRSPKDFTNSTLFWVNDDFAIMRNGKPMKHGRVNLVGKLQLSSRNIRDADCEIKTMCGH